MFKKVYFLVSDTKLYKMKGWWCVKFSIQNHKILVGVKNRFSLVFFFSFLLYYVSAQFSGSKPCFKINFIWNLILFKIWFLSTKIFYGFFVDFPLFLFLYWWENISLFQSMLFQISNLLFSHEMSDDIIFLHILQSLLSSEWYLKEKNLRF